MLVVATAFALVPPAQLADGRVHPPRFQVDGWVSSCRPGTDGFAAECKATKKVGRYRLELSVGDDQFFQSIEHPDCQYEFNSVFRDEAPMSSDDEQRRWIVMMFDKMAAHMAKRCPKLPRLNHRPYQHPPLLNSARDGDVG